MIYVHIPFCRQICSYCDFHHSASLLRRDEMVCAIENELRTRRDFVDKVKTLYFGGGTPSVCSVEQIGGLISLVRELWSVDTFDELTLEANPEDLTSEYLDGLLRAGVNRLSIGIQSFHADHLQKMNRRHSPSHAIDAVKRAQAAGFDNITIDLIYGLPWLTMEQWGYNIETAIGLDIQHISAYHLTIEPRTVLGKQRLEPVADSVSIEHYELLRERLTQAGYEHYEVSNFAHEGRRAIHNSGYWHGEAYLGVGPSAHSFDGSDTRHWNVSSNKLYLEGNPGQSETLTPTDHHNEYLMTRLRTSDGFRIAEYESRFATHFVPAKGIITNDGYARITPKDLLIADSIISSMFRV